MENKQNQTSCPVGGFKTMCGGQALIEGILMRGPKKQAIVVRRPDGGLEIREKELKLIRTHTTVVKHYRDLQSIADYPVKVRKLIRRLRRIRIDRLISRIL